MMLTYLILPCAAVHMGINLRSGYALVSEKFLNRTQVRPVFNQMGRKGMSERMGRYIFPYVADEGLPLYHLEHGLTAQRPPEPVQEKNIVRPGIRRCRSDFHISLDRFRSNIPYRDKPFLVAFSYDSDEALVHIKR